MLLFCSNPYCSWTSMFAFYIELLAVLVIQFNANTLINFQLDLAVAIPYFIMSLQWKFESKFISHAEEMFTRISHSGQERPGVEQQNPGKLEPRCMRSAQGGGSWHSSYYPENMMLASMHHSHTFRKWNERHVFHFVTSQNLWKSYRDLCSHRHGYWQYSSRVSSHTPYFAVTATRISMQESWGAFVPKAMLTANFNLAVGYQDPRSHWIMNFRVSSVLS